jgi:purine-binding chemotaxis protein CheW
VRTNRLFRLGEATSPEGGVPRVIVCQSGDQQIGLMVDEVTDLIPYSAEQVQQIPVLSDHMSDVLLGCFLDGAGRQVVVLNDTQLLLREEIRSIQLDFLGRQKESAEVNRAEADPAMTKHHAVLTFRLGNLYGMRIAEVLEILEGDRELVRTPNTPAAVLGAMDLRGVPVPVVDPKLLFTLAASAPDVRPRILVFENEGKKIGMQVDSVENIVTVDGSLDQELPDLLFQTEQTRFQEGFERGISVSSQAGKRQPIVLLHARQVVGRLAQALSIQ